MLNRLFSTELKKEDKVNSLFSLNDHRDHAVGLITKMKESKVQHTSDSDRKNAENQLAFLEAMKTRMDEMLLLSSTDISAKKKLGETMTNMPKKYFGDKQIPSIEGEKSKAFALLLAEHFHDFTKVQFPAFEVQASIMASKVPFLNIRSIPDQIHHNKKLALQIERDVASDDTMAKLAMK